MTTKILSSGIFLITLTFVFNFGCEPKPDLPSQPDTRRTITYKYTIETKKDLRFDNVTEGKLVEENSRAKNEIVYDQTFQGFDENGNTIEDIKIKALSFISESKEGVADSFDSTNPVDSNRPLTGLVNHGYTVTISPKGQVVAVSNVEQVRNIIKTGPDSKIAADILRDEVIKRRHSISALKEMDRRKIKKGYTWNYVETPQVDLLVSKAFEKFYTVQNLSTSGSEKIAIIEMNGIPYSGTSKSSAEIDALSKILDSNDVFTGNLVINISTGQIVKFTESLVSINTAVQMPGKLRKNANPDVLELTLKWTHSLEAID